jgi:hypothetical protein
MAWTGLDGTAQQNLRFRGLLGPPGSLVLRDQWLHNMPDAE